MQETLEALEELARIDLGFRQLEIEVDELQKRLAAHKSDVERIRELLEREKTQSGEAETLRTQSLRDAQDIGERLARSVKRQQTARNAREMEALTREVEVLRREREERISKAGELETAVAQMRESITKHEVDFVELQTALGDQEATIRTALDDVARRRTDLHKSRETVTVRVRAEVLRKYETIRERRGTAVAQVSDGICRACHVRLPPQLFMQLHSAKQIHNCPNCQRILMLRAVTLAPPGA